MTLTNFPNGITSFGVPILGAQGLLTQGKAFFIRPNDGSDGNSGLDPDHAFDTVKYALSQCTANQNDTMYQFAQSNTAGNTTDYNSDTDTGLVYSKDLTHWVGVGNLSIVGQRARYGWISTINNTTNTALVNLTANGANIINVAIFAGVNDAQAIGALKVTGSRNYICNTQISGIGHDTQDATGAYSLLVSGGAENTFENCYIGLDTIARGTNANSEILFNTLATRNIFKKCLIVSFLESATNHPQVKIAAAADIDRFVLFDDCMFINESSNYATNQNGIMSIAALTEGFVIVKNCVGMSGTSSATKWDVNDNDKVRLFNSPTPAADTAGLTRDV